MVQSPYYSAFGSDVAAAQMPAQIVNAIQGQSTVALHGETFLMPISAQDAVATLKNMAQNGSNSDWQITLMVLALVEKGDGASAGANQHAEVLSNLTGPQGKMSAAKFAALGIKGLKSHVTVLKYLEVGQWAVAQTHDDGTPKYFEMPKLSWDPKALQKVKVPSQSFKEVAEEAAKAKNGPASTATPGKFDALAKAIKGMDSADVAAAIKMMAAAIGMDVELMPVENTTAAVNYAAQDKAAGATQK